MPEKGPNGEMFYPRRCTLCKEHHINIEHDHDVQDEFDSLGMPRDVQERYATWLRESIELGPTGEPGRPPKYLDADARRAANARYQREYRRRKKQIE